MILVDKGFRKARYAVSNFACFVSVKLSVVPLSVLEKGKSETSWITFMNYSGLLIGELVMWLARNGQGDHVC